MAHTHDKIITIFGAAGFVGTYVTKELARAGYRLRVIVRDVEAASHLKTQGDVGQIAIIHGDITKADTYQSALKDAYAVVNLVGILFESSKQTFASLHAQAPEKLAVCAKEAGVKRFLHMSALGVDRAKASKYARTKLAGEKAVLAAFPDATIFRPSVIFGAEDNFYNQFAQMSVFAPALPLIGGGKTKFQPVYVVDVAEAFAKALADEHTEGNIYELGGPEVQTFEDILKYINTLTHRDRALLCIPSPIAHFGATFAELLPTPPLTRDQVKLLKYDNVVEDVEAVKTFKDLDIEPTHPDGVVPEYLEKFAREVPKSASL